MRYREILESCWKGYQQQGMKKKGDRMVPNCVRVTEQEDQKFAIASHPIPGDKFKLTINNRPFILTPGGFGKQHSQVFLDSFYLTDMKSGKTEFVDSWYKWPLAKAIADHLDQNHAEALVRIGKADFAWHEKNNDWDSQPPRLQGIRRQTSVGIPAKDFVKSVDAVKRVTGQDQDSVSEQQMEEDLRKWFKEKWVRFGPDGKIRGACARGSESEGKPKCLPQSKAHALGKKGRASAAAKKRREDPNPERRGKAKNVPTKVKEATGDPRFDKMMGRIVDPVAALKQDRVYEEQLEDYVFEFMNEFLTRMDQLGIEVWLDNSRAGEDLTNPKFAQAYEQASLKAVQKFMQRKKLDTNNRQLVAQVKADFDENADQVNPVAGFLGTFMQGFTALRPGEIDILSKADMFKKPGQQELDEKQDACYRKVKSRYKVWPSAYASGALVQCRKKGAANWGNKKK